MRDGLVEAILETEGDAFVERRPCRREVAAGLRYAAVPVQRVSDPVPRSHGPREAEGLRQNTSRVFQVTAVDLRTEFPPLKSMDPRRHNLPVSPTGFVGRDAELAQIKHQLSTRRMLTLIGSGGTGKTRLALQAAADMIDGFKDGVWLVELASLSEPELVAQTAAESLGIREEAGRPISKTLAEWLGDKTTLLVIDNCEHLVAAVVELAAQLLRDCPGVRLLATSRAALRVNGEAIMRVGALPEQEAVSLFADRFSAAQPAFRFNDENSEAIARICRRVEGIPLAIELAAGRARMMSPDEILAQLQDSFAVLAGGSRSAQARHETLRAAMDWSYWLLDDDEKRVFRRLSVFAGGFTLDAAQAVCGEGGAGAGIDLIGQLVDKSLVTPQESAGMPTRYTVLETVKEYGRARLVEHAELESTQSRHANFYSDLAAKARAGYAGAEKRRWLTRLGADVDNLRAVFDVSTLPASATLELAVALADFWEARSEYSEGRARLEAALRTATATNLTRAHGLRAAGLMAWAQGDQRAAADYTGQALALSRELGDREGEAQSLQQLGQVAIQLADFAQARTHLDAALKIATGLGLDGITALVEWRLGMVALFATDMPGAGRHIEASLEMSRRNSDAEMVAMSLLMLGNIALWQGRLEESQARLRESLELLRREGSSRSVANLLESMAAVAAAQDEMDRALILGGAAEGLRKQISVVPSSPFHKEISNRLAAARRKKGAVDKWQEGAAMSREEAIAYALEEPLPGPSRAAGRAARSAARSTEP